MPTKTSLPFFAIILLAGATAQGASISGPAAGGRGEGDNSLTATDQTNPRGFDVSGTLFLLDSRQCRVHASVYHHLKSLPANRELSNSNCRCRNRLWRLQRRERGTHGIHPIVPERSRRGELLCPKFRFLSQFVLHDVFAPGPTAQDP